MSKRDKRPERIDISSDRAPLTSNPFAALRGPEDEPSTVPPAQPEIPAKTEGQPSSNPRFSVQRTKKGGFPVFLEKRPNGKSVTVVRNVSGDLEEVLAILKRQCGAGGVVRDGAIEIQGDHRERVETYLKAQIARSNG